MSASLEGITGLNAAPTMWPAPAPTADSTVTSRSAVCGVWSSINEEVFNVFVTGPSDRPTLVLEGELDLATVVDFELCLTGVERERPQSVLLDLSRLRFLDCSGLHSLVSAEHRIRARGGKLSIVPGPRQVQRLFELTSAGTFFEHFNEEKAG